MIKQSSKQEEIQKKINNRINNLNSNVKRANAKKRGQTKLKEVSNDKDFIELDSAVLGGKIK